MSREVREAASAVGYVDLESLLVARQENTGAVVPEPAWAQHNCRGAECVVALQAISNRHA